MLRITSIIERTDGEYTACIKKDDAAKFGYGLFGMGKTPVEAAEDFLLSYEFMNRDFEQEGQPLKEAFFMFEQAYESPDILPDHIVLNEKITNAKLRKLWSKSEEAAPKQPKSMEPVQQVKTAKAQRLRSVAH
ncbi:MAG: hypothetical protein LBB27_04065 [Tannerellaceae bacterium]|jgi:hypothetical protein|nr:hypothetical protein [Tannerellaceae bacterium]